MIRPVCKIFETALKKMGYYELAKYNPRILFLETLLVSFVLLVAFFLAQFFTQIIGEKFRQDSIILGRFLQLVLSVLVMILFVWLIYDIGPEPVKIDTGANGPLVTEAFVEALDPSTAAPA